MSGAESSLLMLMLAEGGAETPRENKVYICTMLANAKSDKTCGTFNYHSKAPAIYNTA